MENSPVSSDDELPVVERHDVFANKKRYDTPSSSPVPQSPQYLPCSPSFRPISPPYCPVSGSTSPATSQPVSPSASTSSDDHFPLPLLHLPEDPTREEIHEKFSEFIREIRTRETNRAFVKIDSFEAKLFEKLEAANWQDVDDVIFDTLVDYNLL